MRQHTTRGGSPLGPGWRQRQPVVRLFPIRVRPKMYSIPPANLIIAGSLANFSDILYFSICHLRFDGNREYFWSIFCVLDTRKFNTRDRRRLGGPAQRCNAATCCSLATWGCVVGAGAFC